MKSRNKSLHGKAAIEKELKLTGKQEETLRRSAVKTDSPAWKQALVQKVPEKVYENLQKAFCKAFSVVFEKGTGVIEKTYDRNSLQEDYEIQSFAFQVKANRRALKRVRRGAALGNLRNMAVAGVEGIGLGALGIGLPDIVVFVGVLLKGIYEIALHYGFDYDLPEERYFILQLMETAMLKGEDWVAGNEKVDCGIAGGEKTEPLPEEMEHQIGRTADAFAMDMVLQKFIQGIPVVGVIGGAANPVYYNRVLKYVEVKYRKRYLLGLQKSI